MKIKELLVITVILFAGCKSETNLSGTQTPVKPPLMGWSSWNGFRLDINDSIIRQHADLLVELKLKDAGYQYVNIDDGYFGPRDEKGNMTPHPKKFPDGMKSIADYIHSLGLKAGLYTDAGCYTCGSLSDGDINGKTAGIYGYETRDINLYFNQWGYDYIKIDYCGATDLGLDEETRYRAISKEIEATGRKDISINVCRWNYPGTWVKEIADSWRVSGDTRPEWRSVRNAIEKNLYLAPYAGDGHYNDMDMLLIGFRHNSRVGGTGLTPQEEEAHFGLWCIMSSPLLIGCDLGRIPRSSLNLLLNEELIAINQDVLGLQAYVAQHENEGYVLVKDILETRGKTRAVALYNPSDTVCSFVVPFKSLELGGEIKVRDLVRKEDLGTFENAFVRELPAHSAMILKMEAQERLEPDYYEAEWAYLPLYDDLGKNSKAVRYSHENNLNGKVKVGYLGGKPENYAEWNKVYSEKGGAYDMTISYCCGDVRSLEIEVNGNKQVLKGLCTGRFDQSADITIPVILKPGYNCVRMGCGYSWAPDIDCFTLKRK